ncbi:hypothetical protein LAUMK35_02443 [Mycobacterium pseudokansasii]|nr:hypothetical protein A4G27_25200 [Mycobacterium kansasii]VAZ93864.1 hypothetical protein LAUMK35_02443 [Mycobacterium pseudokansasii]VAZ94844.1 hypothetical protein LAUMK21_02444 [Mycobacterium pseudokansasii]
MAQPEPVSVAAASSAGTAADHPAGTDNLPTEDAEAIPASTGLPPEPAGLAVAATTPAPIPAAEAAAPDAGTVFPLRIEDAMTANMFHATVSKTACPILITRLLLKKSSNGLVTDETASGAASDCTAPGRLDTSPPNPGCALLAAA